MSRRMSLVFIASALVFSLALLWALSHPETTTAQTPTPNIVLQPIATGLSQPVGLVHAGDGSGRLFVVEKSGYIRILRNGAGVNPAFLDIHTLISTGNEQGLLGLAFHPNYETNRQFYVFFTNTSGNLVVDRYLRQMSNPEVADTSTRLNILTIAHPTNSNHNGGQLQFGPDGYLYIAAGDGGGSNDPCNCAQRLDTLLGKILRIDVNSTEAGNNYAIPAGNPYKETPTDNPNTLPEIWHYGLRNPWRFSFDRQTGEMFIGDVGQGAREEVSYAAAGAKGINYGWNIMEGSICRPPTTGCSQGGLTLPINDYDRTLGFSITGGYRYRGARFPMLAGIYFFADYGSGRIWGLRQNGPTWTRTEFLDTTLNISSFGEDEAGELYVVHIGGTVSRLINRYRDTGGVFRSSNSAVYLRNALSGGPADLAFPYGASGDLPLAGDWDGDSTKTVGIFRTATFYLRNANSAGPATTVFAFGQAGDVPLAGDWDGDGDDTVGVFRNGVFYLRNSNSAGSPDIVVAFGAAGDRPVVGDWNGDGIDGVGVFRNGAFYLRNALTAGSADLTFAYGLGSDLPVAGDWDQDGDDSIGVYRNGVYYLRNTNDAGNATTVFSFGVSGDKPLVGDWDALP